MQPLPALSPDDACFRSAAAFWAERLGVTAPLFATPGVHVVPRRHEPPRLHLLALDGTLLVTGDPSAARRLGEALRDAPALPTQERVESLLGARVTRCVGPAWLGYREDAPELPEGPGELRTLGPADRALLSRLRDAVPDEEWEHAGLDLAEPPIQGVLSEEMLLAVGCYERLADRVAHVGVLAHPTARRRGAGLRAAAAAARAGAEAGLLLQYQTLAANAPSLAIGRRLGFRRFAESLAIRLA